MAGERKYTPHMMSNRCWSQNPHQCGHHSRKGTYHSCGYEQGNHDDNDIRQNHNHNAHRYCLCVLHVRAQTRVAGSKTPVKLHTLLDVSPRIASILYL